MDKKSYTKPILIAVVVILATAGIVFGIFSKGKGDSKPKSETSSTKTEDTANNSDKKLKDGEYEGSAKGYGGELTVRVTIKDGKIADIKVVSHNETPEYFKAASAILDTMIKNNTFDVDAVSGATITSNALKSAVSKALIKAGADENTVADQLKNSSSKISKGDNLGNSVAGRYGRGKGLRRHMRGGSENSTGGIARIPRGSYLRDGVFTGRGIGYRGPIKVAVTIKNGKIADVRVLSHSEDNPYFSWAKSILRSVVNRTNANVDTVSGATYSSRGLISAINDAVSKAVTKGGDDSVADGGHDNSGNGGKKPDDNKGGGKPDDNKGGKDTPPPAVEKDEMKKVNDNARELMKKYTLDGKFLDGKFVGQSSGYQESIVIKSEVTFKNNKIEDITFPIYGDDPGYKPMADGILPILKGNNGMKALATMKVFGIYLDKIYSSDNMYETAVSLVGKRYAEPLKGLKKTQGSSFVTDMVCKVLKKYMSEQLEEQKLFDSVSGATVSANGMAKSVYDAAKLSNDDYKTGNSVSSLEILKPTNKNHFTGNHELKANKDLPLNLKNVKIALKNKDGSSKEIDYADFAKNKITLYDRDTGKEIKDGMSLKPYTDNGGMVAVVKHTPSGRHAELSILVGDYSDDYLTGLEYSVDDGKTWVPVKSDSLKMGNWADSQNIADDQTLDLPLSDYGKEVKIRVTSVKGNKYTYTQRKHEVSEIGKEISYFRNDADYKNNSNLSYVLHIKFKGEIINGKTIEETKLIKVKSESEFVNNKEIKPIEIEKIDSEAKVLGIANLPPGLTYKDGKIVGTPKVSDDAFGSDPKNPNKITYQAVISVQKGYTIYRLKLPITIVKE